MGIQVRIPEHVTKQFVEESLDVAACPQFRKTALTPAIRMAGPFTVETREGTLECSDGWLAIDAGGWPYPIAADEFDRIYEPGNEAAMHYVADMP